MDSVRQPLSVMLNFRLTEKEAELVRKAAKDNGLSLSDWLRKCLMTPRMEIQAPEVVGQVNALISDKGEIRKVSDADLDRLITQLRNQGMTTPVARREARKRLGL